MKKVIDVQLSPAGYAKLKAEYEDLAKGRPEAVIKLTTMREMGDLSENAGYHAAKERLNFIDRRMRELKILLRFSEVIEATDTDSVGFGSTVVLDDGEYKREFTIVGGLEADPLKSLLSPGSPIGAAIMGKKVGDKVLINVPDGQVTFTIVEIKI